MRTLTLSLALACKTDDGATTNVPPGPTDSDTDPSTDTTTETTTTSETGTSYTTLPVTADFTRPRVAVNDATSCWLRPDDSTIECWGQSDVANDAPRGAYLQIDLGGESACVLDPYGVAVCWGDNTFGQLNVPDQSYFIDITVADRHACGIETDGGLLCWGSTGYGMINAPDGAYVQVDAQNLTTCAIRTDGLTFCWGNTFTGQAAVPPLVFTDVDLGEFHVCGKADDGALDCWGIDNTFGQLDAPIDGGPYVDISAGHLHGCALSDAGVATCWGDANLDRLEAPSTMGFIQIDAAAAHTCAITESAIDCWGDNTAGQLP